jgi:hypothetical protein
MCPFNKDKKTKQNNRNNFPISNLNTFERKEDCMQVVAVAKMNKLKKKKKNNKKNKIK